MNVYNEIEPYAVEWTQRLSKEGQIAPGRVDGRSVEDVRPEEVRDATQFHAFAGIGVWSHALRLAGWPDDRPVWTGSCPCQPFSNAGRRKGADDARHLWPAWYALIRECRPPIIFGEQVASPDGRAWLRAVQADLEALGYAVAGADLCAAGVGAPHIRQRLFWCAVGYADSAEPGVSNTASFRELDNPERARLEGHFRDGSHGHEPGRIHTPTGRSVAATSESRGLADDSSSRRQRAWGTSQAELPSEVPSESGRSGPTRGFWSPADWLSCSDGKARPVEPGTFPLAHGATQRVGRLRAYGNAIVPQVAATFIESIMEIIREKAA